MADSINYQLAKFVASYGKVSQIPESTCPEVSFVGRSNVCLLYTSPSPRD